MSGKRSRGPLGIRPWGLGRWRSLALIVGGALAVPHALAAQGKDSSSAPAAVAPVPEPAVEPPAAVLAAAETITAAELARHLHVLAADSLRGRAPPGPALAATAR